MQSNKIVQSESNAIELESKTVIASDTLSNDEFLMLQKTAFSSPHLLGKMVLSSEIVEKLLLKRNEKGVYLSKILNDFPDTFLQLLKKVSSPVVDQMFIEQALSVDQLVAACTVTNPSTTAIDKAFSETHANKNPLIINIINSKKNYTIAAPVLNKMSSDKINELITAPFGKEKHNLLHSLCRHSETLTYIKTVLEKASSTAVATSLKQTDYQNCSPIYFLLGKEDVENVAVVTAILNKAQLSDYELSELFIKPQYDNAALLMFAICDVNAPLCLPILKKMNTLQMLKLLKLGSASANAGFLQFVKDIEIIKEIYTRIGSHAFSEALCVINNNKSSLQRIFSRAPDEVILFILKNIEASYLKHILNNSMFEKILEKPKMLILLIQKISASGFMRHLKDSAPRKDPLSISTIITILNQIPHEFYAWFKSKFVIKPDSLNSLFYDANHLITQYKNADKFIQTQSNAWIFIADIQLKDLKAGDFEKHDQLLLFKFEIYLKMSEHNKALKCIEEISLSNRLDINTEFKIVNLYRTQVLMHTSENSLDKSFNALDSLNNMIAHANRLIKLTESKQDKQNQAIYNDTKKIYEEIRVKYNNIDRGIFSLETKLQNEDKNNNSDSQFKADNLEEKFKQQLKEILIITNTFKDKSDSFFSSKNRNIFNKLNDFYNELKFAARDDRLQILNKGIQNPIGIKAFDDILKSIKQDYELNSKLLNVTSVLQQKN